MKLALISMPFISSQRPSIQLGTLKAFLETRLSNIQVDDFYFNIDFGDFVGGEFCDQASFGGHILMGEWLFAKAAFDLPLDLQYLKKTSSDLLQLFPGLSLSEIEQKALDIRENKASEWIDRILESKDWGSYTIVGFSCTFCQIAPSLALARRLRELHPKVKIVFGGSALESEMGEEVYRQCSLYVDAIVQGEGEHALENYCLAVQKGLDPSKGCIKSHALSDINSIPTPNFDTYFELRPNAEWIMFESSRGCWWGEKRHCKFCGLNGETMKYRSKSPAGFLQQLEDLESKYERHKFEAVDNILDHRYIESVLPALIAKNKNYEFFFETKANLSREKFERMVQAGIRYIQPGIESLSTPVLKIMDKGVSASQNLFILQLAAAHGVALAWNQLYGFPGEQVEDYESVIDLIPKIRHLTAPGYTGPIRLDRFSPYFNQAIARLNGSQIENEDALFDDIHPSDLYGYCFPKDWNYWKLAYYYSASSITSVPKNVYEKLRSLSDNWKNDWNSSKRPRLEFRIFHSTPENEVEKGIVFDSRETPNAYELSGQHLQLAKLLELNPMSLATLREKTPEIEDEERELILQDLQDQNLLLLVDQRFHWLPLRQSTLPLNLASHEVAVSH